ncbi:MAG: response regulator, partial [Aquincola sp.]|nr:response regulator [Aquincola sp.]
EAVQAVQQRTFDAVLMDLHMPELDGVGATTAIRRLPGARGRLPIIALTADAFPETRERCMAAGMTAFLTKPVEAALLVQTLASVTVPASPTVAPSPAPAPVPAPAPPPLPAADLLNRQVLANVLGVMPRERLAALAEGFLQDCRQQLPQLRQWAAEGQMDPLRAALHAMKGAALNLGLQGLATTAQAVREQAQQADAPGLQPRLDELQARLEASAAALRDEGLLAGTEPAWGPGP